MPLEINLDPISSEGMGFFNFIWIDPRLWRELERFDYCGVGPGLRKFPAKIMRHSFFHGAGRATHDGEKETFSRCRGARRGARRPASFGGGTVKNFAG